MQISLKSLTLNNFKGISHFTLDAQGKNINVFGDNATGKTTLYDAFLYALFDKDSENKKDFAIKTLDAVGNTIHNLEHAVEAVFEVDGKQLNLRKVYAEKWTRKRGQATAEFTGHTTDYFIDEVPVKKNEYIAQIADLIDENIFKLITSPAYFCEQLHWQDRRKILMEVCGDLTDQEVIESNKSLAKLPDILQGRTLEDHKKVIASRRTKINDELKKIPVRIDEVHKGLPDISTIGVNDLPKEVADLRNLINAKEQEISRIKNGGEVAEKQRQIAVVEGEIISLKNKATEGLNQQVNAKKREVSDIRSSIYDICQNISQIERQIKSTDEGIQARDNAILSLRYKWTKKNEETLNYSADDVCPTCGQPIPEWQLEEAWSKALSDFNRAKAVILENINSEGKKIKAEAENLSQALTELKQEHHKALTELEPIKEQLVKLEGELLALSEIKIETPPELQEKTSQLEQMKQELLQIEQDSNQILSNKNAELKTLQEDLQLYLSQQAKVDLHKTSLQRIAELEKQEKELAGEFEKLEQELYLVEEFTRAKAALLEDKINNRFKMAKFKLFNVQVNGGLEDTCEILYNGVPYSSGLNNAARVQVGMDIIATLQKYYGITAPVWVDNRESIVHLPEINCQVISLIVSEFDKALRVETLEG